jgi:hypothetical protein
MSAGWLPPATWTETQAQLRKTGSVTLDANGNGVIIFDPDNARQRWVVTSVVVSDNQSATATVIPVAQVALNTTALSTMSQGNQRSATWSGIQDTFQGSMDVGPCDFMAVLFSPPPGTSGSVLAGVICTAIVTGTKYGRVA